MAQSFRHGGSPTEIIERAAQWHVERCEELRKPISPATTTFRKEYGFLEKFYRPHFEQLGYGVTVVDGNYVVVHPL